MPEELILFSAPYIFSSLGSPYTSEPPNAWWPLNRQVMEHFPDFQWVDLARGVLTGRPRAAMEEHLREGCEKCLDSYALWLRLATFAEQERGLEVPESAVRVAENCFSSRAERKSDTPRDSWLSALVATLTFDSRQQPLLAGTRAGGGAAAHLLYSAGKFSIDLHVETGGRPERILMAGQIADATRPDRPLRGVQVAISDGPSELVAVQANKFGEFQCEFDMRADLTLVVSVNTRKRIAVPLDIIVESAGSSPAAEHSDNR
jgi:hypothetical protein